MSLFTEQVVLVRQSVSTETDDRGNPIEGEPTRTPHAAWYEPRTSGEAVAAQNQVVSGYQVALQGHPDLTALDAIEIDGDEYEVDGEPGRVPGGFTMAGYTLMAVKRVTG